MNRPYRCAECGDELDEIELSLDMESNQKVLDGKCPKGHRTHAKWPMGQPVPESVFAQKTPA